MAGTSRWYIAVNYVLVTALIGSNWSSPCSCISCKWWQIWSNYFDIQNDVLICGGLIKNVVSMQASLPPRIFKGGSQLPEDSNSITFQILILALQLQMSFPPTFFVHLICIWAGLFLAFIGMILVSCQSILIRKLFASISYICECTNGGQQPWLD